jgi:hypothetical protein
VVRQYSDRCAKHVANTSRTERSVGLATTLTARLFFELRTQNCNRPSTRGQIDLTLRSVAKALDRARKKASTDAVRRAATEVPRRVTAAGLRASAPS